MIEDKYQLDRSSNLEYLEKLTFKLCKIEKSEIQLLSTAEKKEVIRVG